MSNRDLTEGAIWKALARLSAPMSFGILAVLSIGLADAYFLGQLGGTPLAAIGYIFPVTTALSSLSIGLSAGANAALSQGIGRKDDDNEIVRLALHAFGLGLILSIMVAIAFLAVSRPIFGAMGATGEVASEIQSYLPFWALSFPFLVSMMLVNAVFRAHGDGTTSAVIMILAAVVNISVNPVLIFGLGPVTAFGTQGAAMASAVGQGVAAVVAVTYAVRKGMLVWGEAPLRGVWSSIAKVTKVGAPAALSNAINPMGMALVTAAVATLGDAAVGGFGAATRVQSVALVALLALSAGIGPVVGQNWGADRQDRARGAVRQAWIFCVAYGLIVAVGLSLFARPIATMIASDAAAAEYTRQYLQIVGWSLFGYGILVTANAAMNARSKAAHSMGLSLSRIFIVYLPLAWVGVLVFGFTGVLAAAVAANLFAVFGAFVTGRATGLVETEVRVVAAPARLLPG